MCKKTEKAAVWDNGCIEFSMESAVFAQSINFFKKVTDDLNTAFKIYLSRYQYVSLKLLTGESWQVHSSVMNKIHYCTTPKIALLWNLSEPYLNTHTQKSSFNYYSSLEVKHKNGN